MPYQEGNPQPEAMKYISDETAKQIILEIHDLARAQGMNDQAAVGLIVENIKNLIPHKRFAELFDANLDPKGVGSSAKRLPTYAQERLNRALDKWEQEN